jgi:hypothetical protein
MVGPLDLRAVWDALRGPVVSTQTPNPGPLESEGRKEAMVCARCQDTHRMWLEDLERMVPCTACPVPCQECRVMGRGAYCASTPCNCKCHKP